MDILAKEMRYPVGTWQPLAPISIGIDVGKIHDPTAVAVAECVQRPDGRWREGNQILAQLDEVERLSTATPLMLTHYLIRHIERLPLNTSYPDVARHIAALLCSKLFAGRTVTVRIDVTGVGRPVFDVLCEEAGLRAESRSAEILPITFVPGQKYNRSSGTLGKEYLVSRMQALLQAERVHGPDIPEMHATVEELRVYEIRVDRNGHFTAGAFAVGKHDDLATALGLCVLDEEDGGITPLDPEIAELIHSFTGYR